MGHHGGLGDKKWDIFFLGDKNWDIFFLRGQKMGHHGGLGDKKWDIFFLKGTFFGTFFFSEGDIFWDTSIFRHQCTAMGGG